MHHIWIVCLFELIFHHFLNLTLTCCSVLGNIVKKITLTISKDTVFHYVVLFLSDTAVVPYPLKSLVYSYLRVDNFSCCQFAPAKFWEPTTPVGPAPAYTQSTPF